MKALLYVNTERVEREWEHWKMMEENTTDVKVLKVSHIKTVGFPVMVC